MNTPLQHTYARSEAELLLPSRFCLAQRLALVIGHSHTCSPEARTGHEDRTRKIDRVAMGLWVYTCRLRSEAGSARFPATATSAEARGKDCWDIDAAKYDGEH